MIGKTREIFVIFFVACLAESGAFTSLVTVSPTRLSSGSTTRFMSTLDAEEEARELLERAKKMRAEIASLEGRSLEEVEREAEEQAKAKKERESENTIKRKESRSRASKDRSVDGSFLTVPQNAEDQVLQAANAVERAFKDGINRQIVRFALVPEEEVLNQDRQWPGGAQQMYRKAAGPMTRNLLSEVRTSVKNATELRARPKVTSQDVWDFDGSALITAEAATGADDDVQALVFPNTDDKYSRDIKTIDEAMGDRLFALVNPFWRSLDSWGFNILSPNAKKLAKEAIFDRGFREVYVLLQVSVRGEDCVALKVYPYDWQVYAYIEDDYWPYSESVVRLGSTKDEPTTAEVAAMLDSREEFKMNKNMRNMQRMIKKD